MNTLKKASIILSVVALALVVGIAALAARPDFQAAKITNPMTGEEVNTVTIPSTAVEVAPNIFYLGTALDKGRLVEGYAFVDYKKGFGKPTGCNNDGKCQGWEDSTCADCAGSGGGDTGSTCYGFLSKGARWKTTESYVVASDVDSLAVARDLNTWDREVLFNIFGSQDTISVVDGVDTTAPDDKNEVMFGDISSDGAIAVAIVWGIFNGPPFARELVEYDVVFDNVDYTWGDATVDPSVMDFENIATHEFGHCLGLDDLYEAQCSEQTMYGYANYGETKKRTLEAGDIAGVQELYK